MNREIKYDRTTRDFAAYIDGVLIGFYPNYSAADEACDVYVYETLKRAA